MKVVQLLILPTLLSLFPAISFSQEKNDSKIIAHVNDTTNLFNRVALLLIEAGYSFETKDVELKFIRTTEKSLKRRAASSKINVSIKDSMVVFTGLVRGDFNLIGTTATFSPVMYRRNSTSIENIVWREMDAIASKLGGYLAYEK